MHTKRIVENAGFDSHIFPSNFMRQKSGAFPCATSRLNTKRLRADITAERSGNVITNYVEAIPPEVPLKTVQPTNFVFEPKMLVASHGKDDGSGLKTGNNNENHLPEETWDFTFQKLEGLMAEAKKYINSHDVKYSDSKKREVDTKAQDKRTKSICDDNEKKAGFLSPTEWNKLQLFFKRSSDDAKTSVGKSKIEPKKWSSLKFTGESNNLVESQEIEIVDLVDSSSSENECEEKDQECGLKYMDEIKTIYKKEQDGLMNVKSFPTGSQDEPKYYDKQMELINLSILLQDQPQAIRVSEALKLFEDQYMKILQQSDPRGYKKGTICAYLEAAEHVKANGMWVWSEKPFGHIPGIEIGDVFQFRAELAIIGLHRQFISGIDYVVLDGKKFATSVVNSGRYENQAKTSDIMIYSDQGGISKCYGKAFDQKLERGNLALVNSMDMGYPIRVIYKKQSHIPPKTLGMSNKSNFVYTYDGLYIVKRYWKERCQNKKLVFKFELHRMDHQPRPYQTFCKSRTFKQPKEVCVLADVSNGKENVQIRAMNGVDYGRPLPFIYTSQIVYPNWFQPIEPIGCNCINGCSDTKKCPCVLKNGGEIPFNEKGQIVRTKPLVHECGPLCKCPPSCMNRVSQRGPQNQFEIFKTKSRGWGLRSRNYISSGNFICEYIGELLKDKEAEERLDQDKYLFDISDDHSEEVKGGFAIDAAKYGNVGRFINHSCSPNIYAQEVLYDHIDKRMPHIMFFATKNIPPLCELTYDYNYKVGRVCDVNGNIKTKDCHCGFRRCIGRMY
ncbi:hypothetical protein ACJIZ3_008324 [Penstemon smallii]|uniref:Uncharacterized protein n=1 Tax=Penstemon smallii TaxID=265156 RepID=A0ABD3TAG9_9LAMI